MNNSRLIQVWKCIISFLLIVACHVTYATGAFGPEGKAYKVPRSSKNTIENRVESLNINIDINIDSKAKKMITSYTERARSSTEKILGKSFLYFPIFETYLKEYGLPLELKYLPVIESALNPQAMSSVGAGGLWQLMPATARQYGLVIDDYVDERFDPHKATKAAMKHLIKQYDRFDDWTLALAAYNCGSGRMQEAIKKANSRDYDKLKKYLPKQTQDYILKFVAANYVLNYYLFYDLHPKFPDYNMTITETLVVFDYHTLNEIKEVTGISTEVIQALNPSYKLGTIPPSPDGSYIILPKIGRTDKEDVFAILN